MAFFSNKNRVDNFQATTDGLTWGLVSANKVQCGIITEEIETL